MSSSPELRFNKDRRRSSLWTLYDYSVDDYLNRNPQTFKEQCMFVFVVMGFIIVGLGFVIIGPFLCFFRLTRLARLVILWLWLVLLAILLALVLRFGLYRGGNTAMSLGDAISTDSGLAPMFCSKYSATTLDTINAYLSDGDPKVSDTIITSNIRHSYNLLAYEYDVKKVFLLEGSSINLTVTAKENLDFYFIKGSANMNLWSQNKDCGCYVIKRPVKGQANITLLVDTRDKYYMIFHHHGGYDLTVNIDMIINRVEFDYKYLEWCVSDKCTFDINPFSNAKLVIQAPMEWRYIGVTWDCFPNTVSYMLIFILLPLVLGAGFSFVIVCLCNEEDSDEHIPILSWMGSYADYSPSRQTSRSGFEAIFEESRPGPNSTVPSTNTDEHV